MDTNGVIDQPGTGEATVKTDAGGSATETVATEGSQGQETIAGDSQGFSESGKDQGTDKTRAPRFVSKMQTIYELKQKLRERDSYWQSEVGTLKQQLADIQQMFKPGQERKPSRTFWEAPEEVLEEKITGHLSAFEKRILENLQQVRQSDQETSDWKQETSEAAKFIREQKDITEDDVLELTELIREHPSMERLRPQERAEYALYLYNKEKGISDKTVLKSKAHVPSGAGATGKPRQWTEAEFAQEMNKLGDPKHWDVNQKKQYELLEREIRTAYHEGRVKK